MKTDIAKIQQHYDSNPQMEWDRLAGRKPEFEITVRHLNENLKPNSRILDVGGGAGRYSFYLTGQGHRVTLVDLSEGNIAFAKRKAEELGIKLDGYICASATELKQYISGTFDAVLCMGPIYHLNSEEERSSVIRQGLDLLVPGGVFACSFISMFAKYSAILKGAEEYQTKPESMELIRKTIRDALPHMKNYHKNENTLFERTDSGFTVSNYVNPAKITAYMEYFGLHTIVLTAVECLLSHHNTLRFMPEDIYDDILEITYDAAKNPMLWGSCEHLLYLGHKK